MEKKMINIAWIASRRSFENTFGVHSDRYIDKQNNACYWQIGSEEQANRMRFDRVCLGNIDWQREDEFYYGNLYHYVCTARFKLGDN